MCSVLCTSQGTSKMCLLSNDDSLLFRCKQNVGQGKQTRTHTRTHILSQPLSHTQKHTHAQPTYSHTHTHTRTHTFSPSLCTHKALAHTHAHTHTLCTQEPFPQEHLLCSADDPRSTEWCLTQNARDLSDRKKRKHIFLPQFRPIHHSARMHARVFCVYDHKRQKKVFEKFVGFFWRVMRVV